MVAQHSPAACFLVVGAPRPGAESQAYAEALSQQAKAVAGRVIFAGYRADMHAVLNALDVLVVASSTETGPLVLLEALACGVPVVSTPVGQAPELLADGTAGLLYPIADSQALAKILLQLLDSPELRAAMSRRAREIAIARFPVTGFMQALEEIIHAELPRANVNLS